MDSADYLIGPTYQPIEQVKRDAFTRRNDYRKRLIHERMNRHSSRSPWHVVYIAPNCKIKKDNPFDDSNICGPIIYSIHNYLTRLIF